MDPKELCLFKDGFIQMFDESSRIRELLGIEAGASGKYTRIFPYLHDASVGQEQGAFLCIDIAIQDENAKPYKRIDLIVWSYARQQEMESEGTSRTDLLAHEAYELVNDHTFHARSLRLSSMIPFRPAAGYRGNRMVFTATVTG